MRKRKRRGPPKPNPWVVWEAPPGETTGTGKRYVIPGETLPPDPPDPASAEAPTVKPAAPEKTRPEKAPGTPFSPPPSWGQSAARPGRSRAKAPRPRVPELARRLPALTPPRVPEPMRRLPAPLWWSLPAAARWTRRHAPRAAHAALWGALGAVGVLAGVAAVYGLTRVGALRWDIALPIYAAIAGTVARLIRDAPRIVHRIKK